MSEQLTALYQEILTRHILIKAVFSRSEDKTVLKTVVTRIQKSDGTSLLRLERFTSDNKAYQQNIADNDVDTLCDMTLNAYRQVNLFTAAGNIEILRSKSGTLHIAGKLSETAEAVEAQTHNEHKNYILDATRDIRFFRELGLSDANGRLHDKKQAKYRQINRFLEIIRDVEDKLPSDRPAVIYDLCCGKSYLTFAVYYYFTEIKKRPVEMFGVDLKADVIAFCSDAAKRLGFENLHFVSGNVNVYQPPKKPDMVISLHACDIATDFVLYNAIRWEAGIILSTPCCHHEMAKQLAMPVKTAVMRDEMAFILSHPILLQKFCDSATDALRVKRLESVGYRVTTLELIDPDDTPKNLMIRAVLEPHKNEKQCADALAEYRRICDGLGVRPYLDRLLHSASSDSDTHEN